MRVTVRLGEPYWRQAGVRRIECDLGDGATVAEALRAVEARFPSLLDGEVSPTAFLGEALAAPEAPLTEGVELTLVWAVAGG